MNFITAVKTVSVLQRGPVGSVEKLSSSSGSSALPQSHMCLSDTLTGFDGIYEGLTITTRSRGGHNCGIVKVYNDL